MRLVYIILAALFIAAPAAAQNHPFQSNIRVSCFYLGGLANNLDRVVNEMQVYNNSHDIWVNEDGCTIVDRPSRKAGFAGWYVTDRFIFPIVRIRYQDKTRELAWRPDGVFDRRQWKLPQWCKWGSVSSDSFRRTTQLVLPNQGYYGGRHCGTVYRH